MGGLLRAMTPIRSGPVSMKDVRRALMPLYDSQDPPADASGREPADVLRRDTRSRATLENLASESRSHMEYCVGKHPQKGVSSDDVAR